jgi:hypothetical protein
VHYRTRSAIGLFGATVALALSVAVSPPASATPAAGAAGPKSAPAVPAAPIGGDNPDSWSSHMGSSQAGLGLTMASSTISRDGADNTNNNPDSGSSGNPYGCYGQTDLPHWSLDDASVHGRTTCDVTVGYLSVQTDLYRGRWYGAEYLNGDTSYRDFNNTSYDATPHWNCHNVGTYTYEGDSVHEISDGANEYWAYTSNHNRFDC